MSAAASASRQDNDKAAKHAEIRKRYAWHGRQRRYGGRSRPSISTLRLGELERLFAHRWGRVLPDDDAGRGDAFIAAQHIREMGGDVKTHVAAWVRLWAPWMEGEEAEALTHRVLTNPRRWTADVLAWRLRLTMAERRYLGITTIGVFGMSKADRAKEALVRRREKETADRRAAGVRPRAEYEAQSASQTKPWERFGISRRTWERRGKPQPECTNTVSQVAVDRMGISVDSGDLRQAPPPTPSGPAASAAAPVSPAPRAGEDRVCGGLVDGDDEEGEIADVACCRFGGHHPKLTAFAFRTRPG